MFHLFGWYLQCLGEGFTGVVTDHSGVHLSYDNIGLPLGAWVGPGAKMADETVPLSKAAPFAIRMRCNLLEAHNVIKS